MTLQDDDFAGLAAKIEHDTLFQCTSYKDRCLRRRISARMRACGVRTFAEYALVLDRDRREYAQLLDAVTVNVTRLFRDREMFDSLVLNVMPSLTALDTIQVWCAGTASGEEAYSIAATIASYGRSVNDPSLIARTSVLGTDIDRASLHEAEVAEYAATAFADAPPSMQSDFFERRADKWRPAPEIRAITRFRFHDVLTPPPSPALFDVVSCRNLLIYLEREAQERVLHSLCDALKPGGFLVLGKVEALPQRLRARVAAVDLRARIYRRVG